MNSSRTIALVVLAIAGYGLYLHLQGKFLPVVSAIFATPPAKAGTVTDPLGQPVSPLPVLQFPTGMMGSKPVGSVTTTPYGSVSVLPPG